MYIFSKQIRFLCRTTCKPLKLPHCNTRRPPVFIETTDTALPAQCIPMATSQLSLNKRNSPEHRFEIFGTSLYWWGNLTVSLACNFILKSLPTQCTSRCNLKENARTFFLWILHALYSLLIRGIKGEKTKAKHQTNPRICHAFSEVLVRSVPLCILNRNTEKKLKGEKNKMRLLLLVMLNAIEPSVPTLQLLPFAFANFLPRGVTAPLYLTAVTAGRTAGGYSFCEGGA